MPKFVTLFLNSVAAKKLVSLFSALSKYSATGRFSGGSESIVLCHEILCKVVSFCVGKWKNVAISPTFRICPEGINLLFLLINPSISLFLCQRSARLKERLFPEGLLKDEKLFAIS